MQNQRARKHTWNYDYFNEIDSEHKAYWLGFLLGDGSVVSQQNYKKVRFVQCDYEILLDFCKDIEHSGFPAYEGPRMKKTYSEAWSVNLFHTGFAESLEWWGLSKKSTRPWPSLGDLDCHAVRGLLDADGHVWGDTEKHSFSISFTHASKDLAESVMELLRSVTGSKAKVFRGNGTWQWSISGRNSVACLANWLYKDSTRFLKRKRDRALLPWDLGSHVPRKSLPCCFVPKD